MKNLNKLIFLLLIILFLFLPLINSRLLDIFGLKTGLYVSGNYEFTKVIFFNIFSSIILFLYGISLFSKKKYQNSISTEGFNPLNNSRIYKYFFYIISSLFISTYFSISPYTSLFGSTSKGHGLIMFLNLIGIFFILINLKEKKKKILLQTSIISAIIVGFVGIKELYFPTFEYGQLSNRLVSTFGHPNYIALFLLLILPFLFKKKLKLNLPFTKGVAAEGGIKIIIILFTLLLTKSFIAIFLAFSYLYFSLFQREYPKGEGLEKLRYYLYFFLIFLGVFGVVKFAPEKLSSLISRLFIWESSIKIIFSDFKIFLIGGGPETFIHYFDTYKSEYLYIFEKIGFSADRPHNIILNFFYHFGIIGLLFIIYIYKNIFQNFYKHIPTQPSFNTKVRSKSISLFLGSIFLLFNFASIASYLLIILIFSLNYNNKKLSTEGFNPLSSLRYYLINTTIILFSLTSIYYSSLFYVSEIQTHKNNIKSAINIFPYNYDNYYKIGEYSSGLEFEKYKSEKYYLTKIYSKEKSIENCNELISHYPTVENHFFCGNFLWEIGKYSSAKVFYNSGLKLLPDLWNKDSIYYNNIFIKNFINGNRFFSEKYSNINEILKRVSK